MNICEPIRLRRKLVVNQHNPNEGHSNMDNVTFSTKGDKLVIEVDLTKRGEKSASGKTIRIGSTLGPQEIPGYPGFSANLNVYIKA